MKIEKYACNSCGMEAASLGDLMRICMPTGSEKDPVSCRSEVVTSTIELCFVCTRAALWGLLQGQNETAGRAFMKLWSRKYPVQLPPA